MLEPLRLTPPFPFVKVFSRNSRTPEGSLRAGRLRFRSPLSTSCNRYLGQPHLCMLYRNPMGLCVACRDRAAVWNKDAHDASYSCWQKGFVRTLIGYTEICYNTLPEIFMAPLTHPIPISPEICVNLPAYYRTS